MNVLTSGGTFIYILNGCSIQLIYLIYLFIVHLLVHCLIFMYKTITHFIADNFLLTSYTSIIYLQLGASEI